MMESLVVSLETAKKLKAAGFPQATSFHHFGGEVLLTSEWDSGKNPELPSYFAAPTAQEIADQLPKLQGQRFLHLSYPINLWLADYTSNVDASPISSGETGDNMAEALAALYLELQEAQR